MKCNQTISNDVPEVYQVVTPPTHRNISCLNLSIMATMLAASVSDVA